MDWMLPFRSLSWNTLNHSGLSRRMLRHLFLPRHVSLGSRILDGGCGSGRLVTCLTELGCDASGFDPSFERVARACQRSPVLDFRCLDPADRLPYPEQYFDLVLARDLPNYQANLLGLETLLTTAHLLGVIRPGGDLILSVRQEPSVSVPSAGHLRACFARHLGCFGSQVSVAAIADSWTSRSTWRWIRGRQPRSGYLTAALRLPLVALSTEAWEQQARVASQWTSQDCCAWVTESRASASSADTSPDIFPFRRVA